MGKLLSRGVKLVLALLVAAQGLVSPAGEAVADESLKQLTETTDFFYGNPSISADGSRIAYYSGGRQEI